MARDCRDTAMSYMEYRDRSILEVKEHLKSKGFCEDEISETLDYLLEFHYIDEERYCENYIRYGRSKGKGPIRLQQGLREKGIDSSLLQAGLEEAFDGAMEREAAEKEAKKILSGGIDEKTLARAARRLAGLGYHSSVIYDVIGHFRRSGNDI